ncbi:hypothetical protein BVG79_00344 [Ketogulonicigenium robustum]|uniref:Zinc-ribbon domain-containing protein n=1 Tax=Ketogulonicigenium robustum TaxID=92947 RepID=A0A1W6NX73_9RHOB|nr:putative zinc-binding metallopeptidase [Ketogulonicigenium robustum]ARO13700.1 hypothetical protein BVG79_00344 [Ketogulonicigenium robustum]
MQIFSCSQCGNPVYFENAVCLECGSGLGFDPNAFQMVALVDGGPPLCANAGYDACNWLADGDSPFCRACRHNRTVPDLSRPDDLANWQRIEAAKRHLFYALLRLNLPTPDRTSEPVHGLAFDFLADTQNPDGSVTPVLTGHANGIITLNIAEGDDAERERRRTALGEPYRTLLGHFRHEIGHFYWDQLVAGQPPEARFRAVFGDERADYAAALQAHYANGPQPGWQSQFISSYAAVHPWEDFAETWAHFLHIVDTLETAAAFGMRVRHPDGMAADQVFQPYAVRDVDDILSAFVPLTVAINAVNRSMGQPDLYPFVLSAPVQDKLQFVCDLIRGRAAD